MARAATVHASPIPKYAAFRNSDLSRLLPKSDSSHILIADSSQNELDGFALHSESGP
jgi:hypothetical protein